MYAFADIQSIFPTAKVQEINSERNVSYLLTDSRQIISPQFSIFIALKGEQYDGHNYAKDAYNAGVRTFIISQKSLLPSLPEANVLCVQDTLQALQKLATWQRENFSYPVIGITGSNGKTIVKEWLFQLLREDFHIVRSPKSYNSQVGVPLSVWEMNAAHNLAIFEAGISQKNEMKRLGQIIQPTLGILTNIGAAHDEGFQSREEKFREKLQLFQNCERVICEYEMTKKYPSLAPLPFLTWGRSEEADLQITRLVKRKAESTIHAIWQGDKVSISIPFQDAASLENIMHCWLTLLFLKVDNQVIAARCPQLEQVAMRLELKQAGNNSLLINDSYNSDLTSLKIALRFLDQQSQNLARVVVLSDILQSGKKEQELYRSVAVLLKKFEVKRLIGIGTEIQNLEAFLDFRIDAEFHNSTTEFLNKIQTETFANAAILLKGARKFTFEKIAAALEQKTHNTVLEVNLNALLHNLKVYRSYLRPATKLLVMVKASAYGSGSLETAKLLEYQKVDYFGVAYTDEGVELRKGGIKTPILVLNPESSTFEQLVRYQLEPEIYSIRQLEQLVLFMQSKKEAIGIHLKIETGMNRLGFEENDLEQLAEILQATNKIKVLSIFSHLAGSEANSHDNFSEKQVQRFNKSYATICEKLPYRPFRHILNSSGINRFAAHQMDMVRLGIGIYGVDSSRELSAQLRVVNTLKARISQIKELEKGDTVGYGRTGKIIQATRTATISIGYADGLLRAAGQGKYSLYLHGKLAPIIGNVCMDMCMIDVSHIPEAREGDEVIVFGQKPRAEELSKVLGTIPYEVFTNISERVKRVYVEE